MEAAFCYKVKFMETSVYTNHNLEKTIRRLVTSICRNISDNKGSVYKPGGIMKKEKRLSFSLLAKDCCDENSTGNNNNSSTTSSSDTTAESETQSETNVSGEPNVGGMWNSSSSDNVRVGSSDTNSEWVSTTTSSISCG